MERVTLEISWASLWRIFFFLLLAVVIFMGNQIILGLFLAIIISSGLERWVSFLERYRIPRSLGVILIFVLGISGFVTFVYFLVPFLIADITSALGSLNKSLQGFGSTPLISPTVIQSLKDLIGRFSTLLFSTQGSSPFGVFSDFLGSISLTIAVFVSSFYLSLSQDGVERFLRAVLPSSIEETSIRIYERSRRQIGLWFQTQIVLSLAVGSLVWLALWIIGVKNAALIGLLAAIFELVPFVGPIVAGAVGVLVAFSTSTTLALYTLIAFLIIQQLENHLLIPFLMRRSVGLHPVIVIISLLIGAGILGFLGLLIAVPAAAVFQEIVGEWSDKKRARAAG